MATIIYIFYHSIITFPFFILHTLDSLLLSNLKKEMDKTGNVSDEQLEKLAVMLKKKKSGKLAIGLIVIIQLIDVVILSMGGFFG